MLVESLWRYPVKSMLGQQLERVPVAATGLAGDRRFAVVDVATGKVASAKQPRLWRRLLTARAEDAGGLVSVRLPDGSTLHADGPDTDERLSAFLGRDVLLSGTPTGGGDIDRADPDLVLAHGVEAEVDAPVLALGEAVPAPSFLDYAPLHPVTTATLDHVGTPPARYRPNVVLRTPPGTPPFTETSWVGASLTVGDVVLRIVLPTPRCAVPVLAHGDLPPEPRTLRVLTAENRVDVAGFGVLPVAGVYATVERAGVLAAGEAAVPERV